MKYTTELDKATGLYRIIANKDFSVEVLKFHFGSCNSKRIYIKKGEEGGLIESENNLSQEGLSWIMADSKVTGNAVVLEDAVVKSSNLSDNTLAYGTAYVVNSNLTGSSRTYGTSLVSNSTLSGKARVCGAAEIIDSNISDDSTVYDHAVVKSSTIKNSTYIKGSSKVINCDIDGYITIQGRSALKDLNITKRSTSEMGVIDCSDTINNQNELLEVIK